MSRGRERAARGGLTKQTQADATRTSFYAFAMAWAASRSLYLADGVPLVAIFGMRRRRFPLVLAREEFGVVAALGLNTPRWVVVSSLGLNTAGTVLRVQI